VLRPFKTPSTRIGLRSIEPLEEDRGANSCLLPAPRPVPPSAEEEGAVAGAFAKGPQRGAAQHARYYMQLLHHLAEQTFIVLVKLTLSSPNSKCPQSAWWIIASEGDLRLITYPLK
jgi:hypothetical protein